MSTWSSSCRPASAGKPRQVKDRPDTAVELRARALRLLARREHSPLELERKLRPHAESPEALANLISGLKSKNQLSEARYAEERVRWLARKYGAAKIRHDLKSKGVDPSIVERVSSRDDLERAAEILRIHHKLGTPVTHKLDNFGRDPVN